MSQDLPVIYRAADSGEADVLVHWLWNRGISAAIKDDHATATLQVPAICASAGIELYALDPKQAEDARRLLREHFDAVTAARGLVERGPVEATCEECGRTSTFRGKARGKVEICPHCKAYGVPRCAEVGVSNACPCHPAAGWGVAPFPAER